MGDQQRDGGRRGVQPIGSSVRGGLLRPRRQFPRTVQGERPTSRVKSLLQPRCLLLIFLEPIGGLYGHPVSQVATKPPSFSLQR